MPFRKISSDIKECALTLHRERGWNPEDISDALGHSTRSLRRWEALFDRTASFDRQQTAVPGRPRTLDAFMIHDIEALLQAEPYLYLDEIKEWLADEHGVDISISALDRTLSECGFTYKRLHKEAMERDEEARAQFRAYASQNWVAEQLVFVDETSKDDRTIYRHYGRAPSGTQATVRQPFQRGTRYSIVAALAIDGYLNQRAVEGSVDGEIFLDFIEHEVVSVYFYIYMIKANI
jgi:transposase